jgi:hypothetical protein
MAEAIGIGEKHYTIFIAFSIVTYWIFRTSKICFSMILRISLFD